MKHVNTRTEKWHGSFLSLSSLPLQFILYLELRFKVKHCYFKVEKPTGIVAQWRTVLGTPSFYENAWIQVPRF